MDRQQATLDALADERARVLRAPIIDLDRRDEIERTIAHILVQITEARLVGVR
jgi:hypothetical protein